MFTTNEFAVCIALFFVIGLMLGYRWGFWRAGQKCKDCEKFEHNCSCYWDDNDTRGHGLR